MVVTDMQPMFFSFYENYIYGKIDIFLVFLDGVNGSLYVFIFESIYDVNKQNIYLEVWEDRHFSRFFENPNILPKKVLNFHFFIGTKCRWKNEFAFMGYGKDIKNISKYHVKYFIEKENMKPYFENNFYLFFLKDLSVIFKKGHSFSMSFFRKVE